MSRRLVYVIADSLLPLAHPVAQLNTLPGNPRRGDIDAVARSYEQFGQRKPIVAKRDGTVIAGNHQLQAARQLGWEKIAVVFVDDDDQTAKAFALADNRISDLGTYDDDLLAAMLKDVATDENLLEATGYSATDVQFLLDGFEAVDLNGSEDDGDVYTRSVNIPQYDIVGDEPDVGALVDTGKYETLIAQIEGVELPEELAQFLKLAAARHLVFNYRRIAEFYPHQTANVQRLIEASALVIIDYDDAIANGYVKFAARIDAVRSIDMAEDA